MQLTEQTYEKQALLDLPPNARDLAEELLSRESLTQLLSLQAQKHPPEFGQKQLAEHHVHLRYWLPILQATLLAKATSFVPSKEMTQAQILYLTKLACANAGFPLGLYSLADVIEMSKNSMTALSEWLTNMRNLLLDKKKVA